MTKLIVVATDGSDPGKRAVASAAELAAGLDAEVMLVHVQGTGDVPDELRHMAELEHIADPPAPLDMTPLNSVPGPDTRLAALAHEDQQIHAYIGGRILHQATSVLREHSVKAREPKLLSGDPADAILDAAKEAGADMIVMGSRGMGPLRSILGSVSYKITQLAECTCVLVK